MTTINMKQAKPELIINGEKIEKYQSFQQVDINTMTTRWVIEFNREPKTDIPSLKPEEKSVMSKEERQELLDKQIAIEKANLIGKIAEISKKKTEVFENMCDYVINCYKEDVASPCTGYVTVNTIEATKIILGTQFSTLLFD